jgi:hypothetical protein
MPKVGNEMKELARKGAMAELAELEKRMAVLRKYVGISGPTTAASISMPTPAKRSGRPPLSAAQKKAVSERMKQYWAQRKQKGGGAKQGKRATAKDTGGPVTIGGKA